MSRSKRTHRTATHWGAYEVDVADGKVQALRPFDQDPDPSPIGAGMPEAVEDAVRIPQPMVRKAWLDNGPLGHGGGRGNGPFVAVSWDRALDLAAGEIDRIREEHGNGAIYAGSYGWSSAGRFHHAVSQLHRFMSAAGGYVSSRETYSLAAAEVILPHIVGMGAFEQMDTNTPMKMLAEHTELFVCFGGIPLKNTQVEGGGMGRHHMPEALKLCAERGVKFVNISPIRSDLDDMVNAEWHHPRPNTDVAIMLGMAHVLYTEGLHDQAFLDKCCAGFDKFVPYLTGESDGKPKTPEWAAEISGMEADAIAALAREMAAKVTQLNLSWSCQRSDHGEQAFWMAVTLASHAGPNRNPRRRCRVRIRRGQFDRPPADHGRQADLPAAAERGAELHPRRPGLRYAAQPGRRLPLQRDGPGLSGHSDGLLVRRQPVPPSPGHQPAGPGLAETGNHHRP